MRTRLALVIALALAAAAPQASAAPATAEAREAAIRAYIEELAGPTRFPTMPIKIELTFEMASQRSPEKTNEIMARYADRPDHPERAEWERHANLHASPRAEMMTILFASPKSWHIETGILETATLSVSEHAGVRWMWFDGGPGAGAITLTAAGVPYPATANIWQVYNEYLSRLRLVTNASMPEASVSLFSIDASSPQWSATVGLAGPDRRSHLSGDWANDQPRVLEVVQSRQRAESNISEDFESISIRHTGDSVIPSVAIRFRDDDISERVRLVEVVPIKASAVSSVARAPSPPPDGLEVMDYRTGSREHADKDVPMLVFRPGQPGTRPALGAGIAESMNESVDDARPTPAPADEHNDNHTSNDSGNHSVIIGLIAALVIGTVLVAWRIRKS